VAAAASDGVACGASPATMQSSWSTAVISTTSGGSVGAGLARARTRATLIVSAQPMSSVASSCQSSAGAKRSARGAPAGRSTNVMRVALSVS
jgi:hypothetical protein